VGAPQETSGGFTGAGRAYVFATNSGNLVRTLTSPNAQSGGRFGYSVGIGGNRAVVGAPQETAGGFPQAGNAYVFNINNGALGQTPASLNSLSDGYFGSSVSIGGTRAIVGAPGETANGFSDAGRAHTFSVTTGALVWTLTSNGAENNGNFGYSVAISAGRVVVGAPGETTNGFTGAGNAYVFAANSGSWLATLIDPNSEIDGSFGSSVSIGGNLAMVGAPGETVGLSAQAGNAYVFNAITDALVRTLTSPNAQNGGRFGRSVAIFSSNRGIVGAYGESAGGFTGAGRAYIYSQGWLSP
jgi:hypothetical protein